MLNKTAAYLLKVWHTVVMDGQDAEASCITCRLDKLKIWNDGMFQFQFQKVDLIESDWGGHYKEAPTTPRNCLLYFHLTFTKALAAEMMLFVKKLSLSDLLDCLPVAVAMVGDTRQWCKDLKRLYQLHSINALFSQLWSVLHWILDITECQFRMNHHNVKSGIKLTLDEFSRFCYS